VIATGAYNLIWTHQNLKRTLGRRLRQLRTEYIDVFQFLGVTRRQYFTERVREELAEVREDPRVRAVGISCHDPEFAAALIRDGVLDAVMIRYNAANRAAETQVFPAAAATGARVVGYTATSWTQLLKRPPGWDRRVPTAGACYRFVLSNPAVDVCLTAPRSLAEFRENLVEVRRGPLDEEELAEMRRFGDAVRTKALPVPRHP
jgi:aryl-alcohol dehydrogenase-like predicted oxidoreductase